MSRCPSCADGCCPVCVPAAALIDERDRWIQDCHAAESAAEAMEAERDAMARRLGGALGEVDRLLFEVNNQMERADRLEGLYTALVQDHADLELVRQKTAERAEKAEAEVRGLQLIRGLPADEAFEMGRTFAFLEAADLVARAVVAHAAFSGLPSQISALCEREFQGLMPDGVAVVREALREVAAGRLDFEGDDGFHDRVREVAKSALAALPPEPKDGA